MRKILMTGVVLVLLTAPDLAGAQGIIGGAENGAAAGRNAAGPVGGVVGGAVGGVVGGAVGGVRGVLGLPRRRHLPEYRTFRHHHLRRHQYRR